MTTSPFLEGVGVVVGHNSTGLASSRKHHRCGTVPESHRTSVGSRRECSAAAAVNVLRPPNWENQIGHQSPTKVRHFGGGRGTLQSMPVSYTHLTLPTKA